MMLTVPIFFESASMRSSVVHVRRVPMAAVAYVLSSQPRSCRAKWPEVSGMRLVSSTVVPPSVSVMWHGVP